jgi:hypoxanthine-DNA glycosylase
VQSFAPVVGRNARVLIVGSMPGAASLAAGRYYAHPRNAFWPIVGRMLGLPDGAAYAARLAALRRHGVALWDVLQSCERPGSLDADIALGSAVPNDFQQLFAGLAGLQAVLCNGGLAHRLFVRLALPQLGPAARRLAVARLPSTSPANAGIAPAQKFAAWRAALAPYLC